MAEVTNDPSLAEDLIPLDLDLEGGAAADDCKGDDNEDLYFDEAKFQRLIEDTGAGMDDSNNKKTDDITSVPGVSTDDYAVFQTHLKDELAADRRSSRDVDNKEIR